MAQNERAPLNNTIGRMPFSPFCWPMFPSALRLLSLACFAATTATAQTVFIEAESLANHGGWKLDTAFTNIVGSPYLLAHGLGKPVADAQGTAKIPEAGEYRVWVRTKDWVGHWNAPGAPGRFQLIINGQAIATEFGAKGADWHWQDGGKVTLAAGETKIALHDLTGFDGRCDAIVLTKKAGLPPDPVQGLAAYRNKFNNPSGPEDMGEFDLVVVGGGYGGLGTALSAARQSLKVAFIQDRFVLGGNGSSEIGVWAMGGTMRGKYEHVGEIIEEIADRAPDSPGRPDTFADERKEQTVRAEKTISLFLGHFATGTTMQGNRITAVTAVDVKTGRERVFRGKLFADCTGHGHLGAYAGAELTIEKDKRMGMSNMWFYQDAAVPVSWPATPWALPLEIGDFPVLQKSHSLIDNRPFMKAEWFWESGFDKDPIQDLEYIRDWNLRALYGAFSALKNGPDKAKYTLADLKWASHVGGPRESRLLVGDIVLTQNDIIQRKEYADGFVPTTWDIDLHYAREQYAKKFPENPFISRAQFGKHVDRRNGYALPYRCFYSKNISNLFMAGRQISVTHEALGTVRVMRTIGMMGEVVGKAAYLAVRHGTDARGVYTNHLPELTNLVEQPGRMRRTSLEGPLVLDTSIPDFKQLPVGRMNADLGKAAGALLLSDDAKEALAKMPGIVFDDSQAKLTGKWTAGTGLVPHVGAGYHYAAPGKAEAVFTLKVPTAGKYEVVAYWIGHANRASNTVATLSREGQKPLSFKLNQKENAEGGANSLGKFEFAAGDRHTFTISAEGANGNVHIDAVQLVPGK